MKNAEIRSFSGPYFAACGLNNPVFRPNTGKYGPEKSPYLDNFHAVQIIASAQSCYQHEMLNTGSIKLYVFRMLILSNNAASKQL